MIVRAALAALAVIAAACPAAGQGAEREPDISGRWLFSTGPYHIVCTMTGEVTLSPTNDPGVLEGALVAYEACAGNPRFEARQLAVAVRHDDKGLTITSTIESVTPPSDLYWPDDFELRIVNDSLMVGELRSGTIIAKAQFRRADGPIA